MLKLKLVSKVKLAALLTILFINMSPGTAMATNWRYIGEGPVGCKIYNSYISVMPSIRLLNMGTRVDCSKSPEAEFIDSVTTGSWLFRTRDTGLRNLNAVSLRSYKLNRKHVSTRDVYIGPRNQRFCKNDNRHAFTARTYAKVHLISGKTHSSQWIQSHRPGSNGIVLNCGFY